LPRGELQHIHGTRRKLQGMCIDNNRDELEVIDHYPQGVDTLKTGTGDGDFTVLRPMEETAGHFMDFRSYGTHGCRLQGTDKRRPQHPAPQVPGIGDMNLILDMLVAGKYDLEAPCGTLFFFYRVNGSRYLLAGIPSLDRDTSRRNHRLAGNILVKTNLVGLIVGDESTVWD